VSRRGDDRRADCRALTGAEWTYFGDAFFNVALRETKNLKEAFDVARTIVASISSHRIPECRAEFGVA
jgi:hypothetical protein